MNKGKSKTFFKNAYNNTADLPMPQSRIETFLNTIATSNTVNIKKNDIATLSNDESIPLTILATMASLATACGITIENSDDLYDLGCMFYNHIKENNEITIETLNTILSSSSTVLNNGSISIDSNFLDIVKGFFDSEIKGKEEIGSISSTFGIPYFDDNISDFSKYYSHCLPISATTSDTNFGDFTLKYLGSYDNFRNNYDIYYKDINVLSNLDIYFDGNEANWIPRVYIITYPNNPSYYYVGFVYKTPRLGYVGGGGFTISKTYANTISFPYNGGYTWDNVESKKENDFISLPIPQNLESLVYQTSDNFWSNTNGLAGKSEILIPAIDNSSINICGPYSFSSLSSGGNQENDLPLPQSRVEKLLYAMITGNDSNIEPPNSRIEQYLNYILKNNI